MAIAALVAGIVSWVFCPFIAGIVALVCGQMARNAIRAEPNRWDGNGLALGGMIVGGVNIGFYLLVGILYLLMFVGVFGAAILGA